MATCPNGTKIYVLCMKTVFDIFKAVIHNRFDMSLQVKLVSATIRVDDDPFSKNVRQSLEEGPLRHFRAR